MIRAILALLSLLALSGCASLEAYLATLPEATEDDARIEAHRDSFRQGYQATMEKIEGLTQEEIQTGTAFRRSRTPLTEDEEGYQDGFEAAKTEARLMSKKEIESAAKWGPDYIPEIPPSLIEERKEREREEYRRYLEQEKENRGYEEGYKRGYEAGYDHFMSGVEYDDSGWGFGYRFESSKGKEGFEEGYREGWEDAERKGRKDSYGEYVY